MKSVLLVATIALTGQAMAADSKMNLLGRFDYINTKSEVTSTSNAKTKSSSGEMKPSFLSLTIESKFNEKANVKLALDLVDASQANQNGVSEFIDEAVWTQTVAPGLSLMIGKQAPMMGGHEGVWSDRDLYATSKHISPDNSTGLGLGYSFMDQNLYLQHLELNTNPGTPALTDKKITGLAFYGNLMDGMVSPILSYTKVGTGRPGQYDVFTAAGISANVMNITFQFDYLMRENEKGGTDTNAAVTDSELNSMVAHVRYNHENFKPFFKYIKDDAEGSYDIGANFTGAVESERTVMELGLEYVPNKDEDMCYHLVYSASESEETRRTVATASQSMEKNEENKIYAGVAFGLNVLK
jgi:hypothetical protein